MLKPNEIVLEELEPFARGYVVYWYGANEDVPNIPDEKNPYPKDSKEWKEWKDGAFTAALHAQEGDD